MPVLKDFRKTKEIELPGYPESKVVVFDSLLLKDYVPNVMGNDESNMKKALPKLIKSWNFTNEKGEELPITEENVLMLNINAVNYLVQQIGKISLEEKKN